MSEIYGFKGLEKKYGIKVRDDSYWHPLWGREMKRYKIYSADGCPWENGLSREGVKKECEKWAKELLEIKNICIFSMNLTIAVGAVLT